MKDHTVPQATIPAQSALPRAAAIELKSDPRAEPALSIARSSEPARGRHATSPEEIPAPGWNDILWRVLRSTFEDRVLATAGSVAFFTLLAVFPGLATIISLYGLFADPTTISSHLRLLAGMVPAGALDLLAEHMTRIAEKPKETLGAAFAIGLLVAFWSASSGIAALFDALNVVYKEREKRSLLRFYGTTCLFTFAMIGFAVAAIGAVVLVPLVVSFVGLETFAERLLTIVRWPILLVVSGVILAPMYRYGPSRRAAKWVWVKWGSAVAAALWVAASMLFSRYVAEFGSYDRTYGSLGAGVGFMVWIWLSVVIVLIGAELNAEMEHQTSCDSTRGRPRPLGLRGAVMADTVGERTGTDRRGSDGPDLEP